MLFRVPETVRDSGAKAVTPAFAATGIPARPATISVERPNQTDHGDAASNVALLPARVEAIARVMRNGISLLGMSAPHVMAKAENLTKEDES